MCDAPALSRLAESFRAKLQSARDRALGDFEWYPHDTLANLLAIERLVGPESRQLLELTGGRPVLDIGSADGELAFFLESLGCDVQAIDNPISNFNGMLGIRALRAELGSQVQILPMDIDSQITLPAAEYGLVLILGLLYHLKNPFYLLEAF